MNGKPLLIDEEFVAYFPALGRALGSVEDAVIVQMLWYRRSRATGLTKMSAEDIAAAIGMKKRTVERRMKNLVAKLVVEKVPTSSYDRTSLWRVDGETLDQMQDGEMHPAKVAEWERQSGGMDTAKVAESSYENEEPQEENNNTDADAPDFVLELPAPLEPKTVIVPAFDWFEEFWKIYPRRAGKQAARKAWARAVRSAGAEEIIIAGADRYRRDPNRVDAYTAHPSTWLNQGRWEDDPLPARAGAHPSVDDRVREAYALSEQVREQDAYGDPWATHGRTIEGSLG